MKSLRLNGGVLSLVLVISLLITVLVSSLILYLYYYKLESVRMAEKTRLQRNIQSGMTLTLSEYDYFRFDSTYFLDLFGKKTDSISVLRTSWGLLDLFFVSAFSKFGEESRTYFIGHLLADTARSAIVVPNEGRQLSLAGATFIEGMSYVPFGDFRTGFVERIGYLKGDLPQEDLLPSSETMPEISLEEVYKKLMENEHQVIKQRDTLSNSFKNEPLEIQGDTISTHLVGHIRIANQRKLVFDATSYSSDVVAFAPVIEIREGFQGTGQFFATDSLILEKNVSLGYPSCLALFSGDSPAIMHISEGSSIVGWILIDGGNDSFRQRQLYIEDQARVHGMVYCNGLTELYGTVHGHITTRRFLVTTPSTIYENYLFNATISAGALDSVFLALPQWYFTNSAKVLKYLK